MGGAGEDDEASTGRLRAELVAASFLMLFLELALIRWLGSNIIYLSYFSNFVLLGSFLGIGLGFLRSERSPGAFRWAPMLLAMLVGPVSVAPVEIDRSGSGAIFYGGTTTGLPAWVMLPIVFLVVAAVLATVADAVAARFKHFEPLEAYRLDIIGAIGGILAFAMLSLLRLPPVVWGSVVGVLMLVLLGRSRSLIHVAFVLLIVVTLGAESMQEGSHWSPYYQIDTELKSESPYSFGVYVNGIPHQRITTAAERIKQEPYYQRPHEIVDEPAERMLIIGAGTGTDVAIALAAGVEHIDAVEIDPQLAELGKVNNPDAPYDDPRVSLHIDDGRAFLERTDTTYDQILLALPDSLVLVAGQSALRLESYLFTIEAMEIARDQLAPGGAFSMYNFYREPWLIERMGRTLHEAFGQVPCVDTYGGSSHFAVISVSPTAGVLDCDPWTPTADAPAPATDDHPFPYLRTAAVPSIYIYSIIGILIASLIAVRVAAGPLRGMLPFADLFFMGAAFLLLETKYVVQFALLFGTTWIVNAIVFGGVLLSVYLAIEVAKRVKLPSPALLYGALLIGIGVAYVVPLDALLTLDIGPRLAVAIALAFIPIFIANLVFAQRFAQTSASSVSAFGANLLGAMFGGLFEYLSLVSGYRALLFLVALFYGAAFLFGRRHLVHAPAG